jgi:exodeoxyribonuclease III
MRIAAWNVNSLGVRLEHVCTYLQAACPDILLLQELKGEAEKFPFSAISALGYTAVVVGQKGYNGVAILSRSPATNVQTLLPVFHRQETDPAAARYVEAVINGVRVASEYVFGKILL